MPDWQPPLACPGISLLSPYLLDTHLEPRTQEMHFTAGMGTKVPCLELLQAESEGLGPPRREVRNLRPRWGMLWGS